MNALSRGALVTLQLPPALMSERPDAALLALRAELDAAVADMGAANTVHADDDEKMTEADRRLTEAVKAIAESPPACTDEGRALKGAAIMQELRMVFSCNFGKWPGNAERLTWNLLSEMAGDMYAPPAMPEKCRRMCEPPRRPYGPVFEASAAGLPDVELIRLCAEFDRIEAEHYAEFIAAREDDEAQDLAMSIMAEKHEPLIDRIVDLPPKTLEGAIALARSIENWSHGDFARHQATDELLARTLLRGLTAAGDVFAAGGIRS